jgi:hypothetical protein
VAGAGGSERRAWGRRRPPGGSASQGRRSTERSSRHELLDWLPPRGVPSCPRKRTNNARLPDVKEPTPELLLPQGYEVGPGVGHAALLGLQLSQTLRLPESPLQDHGDDGFPDKFDGLVG